MIRQRGFVWWVYAIIAALLVGIGTTVVLTYKNAIADKVKAENALADVKAERDSAYQNIADLEEEKEALDRQLVIRRQASVEIQKGSVDDTKKIAEAKESNTDVQSWLSNSIPTALIDILRNTKAADKDTKTDSTKCIPSTIGCTELVDSNTEDK